MNTTPKRTFSNSNAMLERALKCIPTGSQTFSKSHIQFPANISPLFLERGKGGRVWDVDGHEYVDLVCGLLPVVLGYQDRDVDNAIRRQLQNGISFSLATELEIELSEKLTEMIPCAEMVRFGKNGTDATSAAIRLARAWTKRDNIVICGYHGWQDWYVGTTTRALGVPRAIRSLTHRIEYGSLDAFRKLLKEFPGDVAAIIMEPMNITEPPPGYLESMRDLAHDHGALFIFDEVITGFRFAKGGAQELFGVTPDLAAFGKALGNGMPISAIVGQEKFMRLFEEVFYSGTFGGETLSLAAANAVIDKIRREPVIEQLDRSGLQLAEAVSLMIEQNGLKDMISLDGRNCWKLINVKDHPNASKEEILTFFIARGVQEGILASGSHNMCYAHTEDDLQICIRAYGRILEELAAHLAENNLKAALGCEPVYPVFSVRSFPSSGKG